LWAWGAGLAALAGVPGLVVGDAASGSLALGVLVECLSLAGRARAGRPPGAESEASLRARAYAQILRSSQRAQSGSPATHVSWVRSSSRSRNSAPRFLGTARSRTARSSGVVGSGVPRLTQARGEFVAIGIA